MADHILTFPGNAQSISEYTSLSLSLAFSRCFMIGEMLGAATWLTHVQSVVKARRRQDHLYNRPARSPSSAGLSWWLRFQSRHLHQSQFPNKEKKKLNFRTLKKLNFMLFSLNILFCTDERAALSKLM